MSRNRLCSGDLTRTNVEYSPKFHVTAKVAEQQKMETFSVKNINDIISSILMLEISKLNTKFRYKNDLAFFLTIIDF